MRSECGNQAVEFALIAPFLLYLVLSVPVFGFAVRSWLVVTMAARDAAREYSVSEKRAGSDAARLAAIDIAQRQIVGQGLRGSNIQAIQPQVDVPSPGYVTVSITYLQPAILPGLAVLLNPVARSAGAFPIEARSTFYIER